MSKSKVHPPLIRALAHTSTHYWAYSGLEHLIEHGIDAYAGQSEAGTVRSDCVEIGRSVVKQHADAFVAAVNAAVIAAQRSGATEASTHAFCRMLCECDDVVLAWWCDTKLGPAMDAGVWTPQTVCGKTGNCYSACQAGCDHEAEEQGS